MPYFFVDGTQGGKPTLAFYIKADNAEAALARAAQLGMVGTGVRPAADAADEGVLMKQMSKTFYFILFLFPVFALVLEFVVLLSRESSLSVSSLIHPLILATFLSATAISILFRLILLSIQVRQRLEVEVRELRQMVESQHAGLSGR